MHLYVQAFIAKNHEFILGPWSTTLSTLGPNWILPVHSIVALYYGDQVALGPQYQTSHLL